jgi:predicted heme/steroid binding protein
MKKIKITLFVSITCALSIILFGCVNSKGTLSNNSSQSAVSSSAVSDAVSSASQVSSVSSVVSIAASSSNQKTFTLAQLSQYNGLSGNKAYVAYNGNVYDITSSSAWKNGTHQGCKAGTDITQALQNAPHGESVLNGYAIVGVLK